MPAQQAQVEARPVHGLLRLRRVHRLRGRLRVGQPARQVPWHVLRLRQRRQRVRRVRGLQVLRRRGAQRARPDWRSRGAGGTASQVRRRRPTGGPVTGVADACNLSGSVI